ncbi:MAG: helix-turn-helix domain-containing protein [Opitutus sp.]|nr:helix-turn-helix domain-containing protein [Opitutus sp.]MCS6246150.1 helix-turn-helix domain-containing protein [Opitutus sp.]MCS6273004.1 helix-turn-helix domain-containing protein [Opitutus sp.]MCS6278489.1 helix-turn-helix domain-containing protein [Opitutus sp.]MCS6300108.1 helix-turn-helix domain-containing protein [Opitutus sp.]
MSFIDQIAELEKAKSKIAQAEAKLVADRTTALAKLPSDYGFTSLNEFIKALTAAAGKASKGKKGKAAKAGKASKAPKAAKAPKAEKRGRTKITPELKAQVIEAVKADKSGAEIAKAFGISLPSVQNIKKEAGLVKSRTAAAPAAVVEAPAAS